MNKQKIKKFVKEHKVELICGTVITVSAVALAHYLKIEYDPGDTKECIMNLAKNGELGTLGEVLLVEARSSESVWGHGEDTYKLSDFGKYAEDLVRMNGWDLDRPVNGVLIYVD